MNYFQSILKIKGFPIEEAQSKLVAIQNIPANDYENYLESKRREIVDYHLKNNLYYQNIARDHNMSDWSDIPILTKKDLQAPLNSRLSQGFSQKSVYVNKTSGSSGHPFIFAKDKMSHALTWAYIIDRYDRYGIDYGKSLQARFYGIPLDFVGYRKERLKDVFSSRYRFPVFDLSDEMLEKYLKKFRSKKFEYIYGYTSSLVLFAKFLKERNLVLNQVCPTLRCCITTSEMLFPDDKLLLEETYGVYVINEYGASESDLIAFTNKNDDFELNNETLFVEILDDNNMPVPHGTAGNIVVTSLYNEGHPFIRYALGDMGVIDPKSTAKNQILKKLVGRTNDVAVLENGKKIPGLTFYYVTKSVIDDDGNIKEFIVEQMDVATFKVTYTSTLPMTPQKQESITAALEKYVGSGLNIIIERKEILDRGARGKLKQFISHL